MKGPLAAAFTRLCLLRPAVLRLVGRAAQDWSARFNGLPSPQRKSVSRGIIGGLHWVLARNRDGHPLFASATALFPVWVGERKPVTVPFLATKDFHHGLSAVAG